MNKTILIVDDAQSILTILSCFFADDFHVEKKVNGKEALEWMQKGNIPDIIVSDVNMPEMDGLEFISHVYSSGMCRDIPIVILSSADDSTDKIKFLKMGVNDYLIKPFNPEELKIRVENLLRKAEKAY